MVHIPLSSANADKQGQIRRVLSRIDSDKMAVEYSLNFRPVENKHFHPIRNGVA